MKVEFIKDDNGYIWFFYARDVYMRKNLNKDPVNSIDAKRKAE